MIFVKTDEKRDKPLLDILMSSTDIYVLDANKFWMPCYEDPAHEFRTASSPALRTFDNSKKSTVHTMNKTILL